MCIRDRLAQYPLDEAFIAHQMEALYWNGRPGDALGLYRETRSRLIDEQGTEPGPMISELHQRILRGIEEWELKEAASVREAASVQEAASLQEATRGHTNRRSIGH